MKIVQYKICPLNSCHVVGRKCSSRDWGKFLQAQFLSWPDLFNVLIGESHTAQQSLFKKCFLS